MLDLIETRKEIGLRLKEERERLKLNQEVMGAVGGVRKQAQLKYESGASCPSADYLAEIAKIGIDIQYVVLGTRADTAINEEELLLLQKFRNAAPPVRQFMLGGVTTIGQNFESEINGGQFSTGTIHNHYKEK
jgi:transcriptional regulator, XRE family|nr:MAG TPA: transcriptional regulator, HTH_3 family, Transcriptional Regulaator, Strucutral.9A [Caudoviricetes sp.]